MDFSELNPRTIEEIPEISSTSSSSKNRAAFYNKIRSRKYKFILNLLITTISFCLIIWIGLMTRGTILLLEKLEFELPNFPKMIELGTNYTALFAKAEEHIARAVGKEAAIAQ